SATGRASRPTKPPSPSPGGLVALSASASSTPRQCSAAGPADGARAYREPEPMRADRAGCSSRRSALQTRLRATQASRGIAQLRSYQVADERWSGALVRLLQPWKAPPLPVQIIT